jgi:fatty-acyl-CoA synthase
VINLSSFIRYHARSTPDRCAIRYDEQEISYGEFYVRIERLAGYLLDLNVCPGQVVAVLMKNSAAFLEIAFAVSHIGAVFLPINFRLSGEETNYICENSGAVLLFADEEFANLEFSTKTVFLDSIAQVSTLAISSNSSLAPMHRVGTQDLFRLMYTSGTTDRPKGVMHSYENFHWKCTDHSIVLGLDADSRLLIAGPLYHVGAFDLPGVAALWHGGLLVVLREFGPEEALGAIEKFSLNGAWLAPIMTSMILQHPDRERFNVSSMQWVVGGGERTPEDRIRSFSSYFTNARYIDAYGLTESCSGDSFMDEGRELEKIGSTGRATPHVEIEIRDDDGQSLVANVEGEICLRGPKIFKGYWRDEKKTRASFFDDWFRTGDVGYLDEDGFLFLTDRKKDMIISGGENIASSEVERVIRELTQVSDVAVVGRPDPKWGEAPVAVIVLKDDVELASNDVLEYCRLKLAAFKVPKEVIFKNVLPRNPSGKILKRQLREDFL